MPFILAGQALRIAVDDGDSIAVTSESAATVGYFGGSAITPFTKAGQDTRTRIYGPLSSGELIITAVTHAEFEVIRGSTDPSSELQIVELTADQIAAPTVDLIANTRVIYQLAVSPYTRYQSNGVALVISGASGITLSDVTALFPDTSGASQVSGTVAGPDVAGLLYKGFDYELTADATFSALTNPEHGQTFLWDIMPKGFAVTFDAAGYYWVGGQPPVPTGATERYLVSGRYNAALGKVLLSAGTDAPQTQEALLVIPVGDGSTPVAVGTGLELFGAGSEFEVLWDFIIDSGGAGGYLKTPQSSDASGKLTLDINDDGASIFGANKLTWDANEKSSRTAATPPDITTGTVIAAGSILTADCDDIGDGLAVLSYVWLRGYYARTL